MGILNRGKYFKSKGLFWKHLKTYTPQPKTYTDHFWSPNNHDPIDLPEKQHYIDREVDAELDFYEWQLQNGREVFQRGS